MEDNVSARTIARITGVGYALIFALAIHANFAVIGNLPPTDEPDALVAALSSGDIAIGVAVAELLAVMVCDVIVAWGLYHLFRPTGSAVSGLSSLFRVAYTIAFIPVILHLQTAARMAGLGVDPVLVANQISSYHAGFTLTLMFFGVHLMLLGWLIIRTARLPRFVGPFVAFAGFGYVADGLLVLLAPAWRAAHADLWTLAVILAALIGELLLTVILLAAPVRERANG
ncbi:MAG: DUF4386 domain-containing protein [Pseudomonadota bacterium]